jgi:hypothetical protein
LQEFSSQRPAAVAEVLSIRNGGRVFLPAKRIKRGLENPRSVKKQMIEFQRSPGLTVEKRQFYHNETAKKRTRFLLRQGYEGQESRWSSLL